MDKLKMKTGRPKIKKQMVRNLSIPVRMNNEEYRFIHKVSKKSGKKKSRIIREGAIREAVSLIDNQIDKL